MNFWAILGVVGETKRRLLQSSLGIWGVPLLVTLGVWVSPKLNADEK